MSTLHLALFGVLLFSVGCATSAPSKVESFGAPISKATPVEVKELLSHPSKYDGHELVLEGQVAEVCPVKGCWMTFTSGGRALRVTFKDYAYFVPKDSAGHTAVCEGRFEVRQVPADEARHYLEDAGRYDEAAQITGPVESFTFVATGVQLSL